MSFIKGEERILHIKDAGIWYPVAFLTSNSIEESTEFLDTTTRDNAGHKTQAPGLQSYSISFSAIMAEDADVVSKLGLKRLRELKTNRTRIEWKLEALNRNFTDYGQGYVGDISETADVGDLVTFSGTIAGYGRYYNLLDEEAPTAPFLNPLTLASNSVTLDWIASVDNLIVTGYEVRKAITGGTEIIDVGNVLEWVDVSVVQGKSYAYNVRAYDAAGNYSPWSNRRRTQIPIPSGTPTSYLLFEDGRTILQENGIPLETE